MRNIQKNLIPKWTSSSKLTDLIEELPKFCDSFEYQVQNDLLPNIGEYSLNSYRYDINDFLSNPHNIIFKIKVPFKNGREIDEDNNNNINDNDELIFIDKYFLITSTSFLILSPVDPNWKNICIMNYVGDIFAINEIKKFFEPNNLYNNLTSFNILLNNKMTSNVLTYFLCGDKEKKTVEEIRKLLLNKKESLKERFKWIEKNEALEIKDFEEMIKIKEKLILNQSNENIYENINNMYQKIIEIFSSSNNDGFQVYIQQLQKFICNYDKVKEQEQKLKNIHALRKNGGNK